MRAQMQNIYSLLFVLVLLLMGCSFTYTIKNFHSKEKFYEDFNNSAKNKDLNITLINDSSFSVIGGRVLKQDTLYTSTNVFPVNIVKTVNYKTRLRSLLIGILSGKMEPIFAIITGISY